MDQQPEPRRRAEGRRARARQLRMHPLSCAAIAVAIVAGPAFGTGFQGNYSFASGSGSITRGGIADVIDITNSSSAVIDWSPDDTASGTAPIIFLPGGNTATFQSTSGDFTVLNRILASDPGRPIEFDGHVVSQFYAGSGPFHQGGAVWFYAPGGIILGSGAVFDVGSLLLTANAITLGAGNALPNIATSGISLRGATDGEALVDIRGGARINADVAAGSYVAVVAPRIQQNGAVRVHGSAGYIAAEQADLTIANGLFDIGYAVGSHVDAAGDTTLEHEGSTGGPAQGSTANPQRIYLVAVPKNDAITMLVDGGIGYDAAATATAENGVVVLAAGGIRTAEDETYRQFGAPDANLRVGGVTLTSFGSRVIGTASGTASLSSGSIGLTTTNAVDLFGIQQVSLGSGGADLGIGGGTTLFSRSAGIDVTIGAATTMTLNGDVSLAAGGGIHNGTINSGTYHIDVRGTGAFHGNLTMHADSPAFIGATDGHGGSARVSVAGNGSSLTIDGSTTITANGAGNNNGGGYIGTGGSVVLQASQGGTLTATGSTTIEANGTGGGGDGIDGGAGTGGGINITADAGTIRFTAGATAIADGTGGTASGGTGGFGQGGTVRIDADAGSIGGVAGLDATGSGGDGIDGGAAGGGGHGGTVAVNAAGGDVTLMQAGSAQTALFAYGVGGGGASGAAAGRGGGGTGGAASLTVTDASVSGPAGASFALYANGQGGAGGSSGSGAGGTGGAATGGTARVTLTNGVLNVGAGQSSDFNATAQAGAGGGGSGSTTGAEGAATAGHTTITATGDSDLSRQGSVGGYAVTFVARDGVATDGTVDVALGSAATDVVRTGAVNLFAADIHPVAGGPTPASLNGTGGTINLMKTAGTVTLAGLTATTGHFALVTGSLGQLEYVPVDTPPVTGGGVNLTLADGSPLAITGDAAILHTTGVTIAAAGSGGLNVGGAIGIGNAASIAITHANPAGDTIRAASVDLAASGAITATGTTIRAGATEAGTIGMTAGTTLALGDLAAGSDIAIAAPGGITTGALTSADTIKLTATAGNIATGALSAGAGGGNGDPEFAGDIAVGANGSVALAGADAFGGVALLSRTAGTTVAGATGAGQAVAIFSGGPVSLGDVTSGGLFYVGAPAAVNALFGASYVLGQAEDPVPDVPALIAAGVTSAGGGVAFDGTIAAGRLMIGSAGGIGITGAAVDGATDLVAAGAIDARGLAVGGALDASGSSIALAAPGALNVATATVTGGMGTLSLAAGTALAAGDLAAPGGIMLAAGTTLAAGRLQADGSISAASTSGATTLGDVASGGGIVRLAAGTDLTLGNVRAAGSIFLTGGGAITAGDVTAGTGPLLAGMTNSGGGGAPAGPGGIATGFDAGAIERCDDCYTEDGVALPFTINYFGRSYTTAYVSNNGYLTFTGGSGEFTPTGLGTGYVGQPIIAPFFADVDTDDPASAQASYGAGTFAGRPAFGATWNGVGYYDEHADKLNRFQVILTDRSDTGTGNFDVYYNYGGIQWETGDADGGTAGLGGTSAAVGYNAGTGNQPGTFYEQPGSRVPGSFLDGGGAPLIAATNDGVPGQLLFSVRNGQVSAGGAAEPATIHVSNTASVGNTAAIRLGNLSGEAVEVHGAGQVTTGNSAVGDRGSGTAAAGLPFATVLDASNGLIAGDISGAGFVALGGGRGDVSTGTITTTADVAVLTGGTVELGSVVTGDSGTLFVSDRAILQDGGPLAGFSFATLLGSGAFDPAMLAAATPAAIGGTLGLRGSVATGNMLAAAAGDIQAGAITAATAIALRSGRALTIRATVAAPTIALASADVVIGGEAFVGGAGTTSLTFANIGEGQAYAGDGAGATEGAYALDGDELARTQAAALTVDGGAGLTIGDLALHGDTGLAAGATANIVGPAGTLTFTTGGTLQLVGKLAVSDLAAGNGVTLAAGGQLAGLLPDAGIALSDGAGGLAGALTLRAGQIAFTTRSAADALAAATTIQQRSDRLGLDDGNVDPDGYVRAGGIAVDVATALYAQNSGPDAAIASRAGFTAGAGGYRFTTHGVDPETGVQAPVEIAFNGRQQTGGRIVTGTDLYALIDIDPASADAVPGSTVNGCVIGDRCGTPAVPPIELFPPVQDVVTSVIDGNAGPFTRLDPTTLAFRNIPLVSFGDFTPSGSIPLIDEPVTGAGNEDIWGAIGFGREGGGRDKDRPGAPAS